MSPAPYRLKIPGVSRYAAMLAWNPAPLKRPPEHPGLDRQQHVALDVLLDGDRRHVPQREAGTDVDDRARFEEQAGAPGDRHVGGDRTHLGARLVDRPLRQPAPPDLALR